MKFLEKMKLAKDTAKLGLAGTKGKIEEIQKQEKDFQEKQLDLFARIEDLIEKEFKESKGRQHLILSKLNEISQELK